MNYSREIGVRNQWIAEYQAKIAAIEAELDQLWRDEAIAKVDHEVPLDAWNKPKPILCRKCRKEPSLVAKKQREIDAVVGGRLTKVWQDYYVYSLSNNSLWCKNCSGEYYDAIRKEADWQARRAWLIKHENYYDGGC